MTKIIDSNTRFHIDIDIQSKKIIGWDYGQRQELEQELPNPNHRRIFITIGQYNKLGKKLMNEKYAYKDYCRGGVCRHDGSKLFSQ